MKRVIPKQGMLDETMAKDPTEFGDGPRESLTVDFVIVDDTLHAERDFFIVDFFLVDDTLHAESKQLALGAGMSLFWHGDLQLLRDPGKAGHGLRALLSVIDKIKDSGMRPNHITCSTLIKSPQKSCESQEVDKIPSEVDSMEQNELEDVLLSTIVEGYPRVDRVELLMPWLTKQRECFGMLKRERTFGSLIRVFGLAKDIEGPWDPWRTMRSRQLTPTNVVTGCMVEALVANARPEAAFDLVHELQDEGLGTTAVNAACYGTLLKGFSRAKKIISMRMVDQEMLDRETEFTSVTYNTIIDECVRAQEFSRIPTILEDMERLCKKLNAITYGSILKDYGQQSQLDKAYQLFETMKTDFRADKILYNMLLEGCAQLASWEKGLKVLKEMDEANVKPSNFTPSTLMKLSRRSRCSLDTVFEDCEPIAKKNAISLNGHVFSNLVNACVSCVRRQRLPEFAGALDAAVRAAKSDESSDDITVELTKQLD